MTKPRPEPLSKVYLYWNTQNLIIRTTKEDNSLVWLNELHLVSYTHRKKVIIIKLPTKQFLISLLLNVYIFYSTSIRQI